MCRLEFISPRPRFSKKTGMETRSDFGGKLFAGSSVSTVYFGSTKHRTEHRVLTCSAPSTAPGTELLKVEHWAPHRAPPGAHRCGAGAVRPGAVRVRCESKHWRGDDVAEAWRGRANEDNGFFFVTGAYIWDRDVFGGQEKTLRTSL